MKHYYLGGPRQIEIVEEPVPEPRAGEVLIKLAFTAISPGSNVFAFRRGSLAGDSGRGRQQAVYMGSGLVEAVGPDVSGVAPGDRVAFTGNGHQEYVVLPEDKVHQLAESVTLREASLSYLSGWSVSVLHLGQYAAAETVVVVGQGLVGASAALMADQMGARVLALDTAPERVAFSRGLGLSAVEQPGAPGAEERIAAFLGETGVDLILETSGAWQGFRQAISLAREYTRIAMMGIYREPPPADLGMELFHLMYDFPSKFHYKKLQIIGCGYDPETIGTPMPRMATREGNYAYALVQAGRGRLPLGRLVTHVFPPDQIEAVLTRFADGDKSMVGVAFDWIGAE